jgi:D-inositol-3-phosphate glycosyltransferase
MSGELHRRADRPGLRIALISEHASPLARLGTVDAGGQNVYVDKVARELAARGHRVDVFTRRDDPGLPEVEELAPGARVVHVEAGPAFFIPKEEMLGHMPRFAAQLIPQMRAGAAYDLVHANFFMSGLVGLRLKEHLGLPLVMTFHALGKVRRQHQGDRDGFPPERIDIESRIVACADRIVAECPQDEADLIHLYDAAPDRIVTVPCGVDLEEMAPGDRMAARRRLGLDEHEFIVLQLGRMVPRKGVDNVIRAVGMLRDQGPVRLVIVGGDSSGQTQPNAEMCRLVDIAATCGIADRVTFAGHRQRHELASYYAASDVFVTTPWYEPFGITPLEAMAAARPVIGSAVGGIKHSVVDGKTGYLVPPRDPAALAVRLRQLMADPAQAASMGRAGAHRVRRHFTWSSVAEALEAAYAAVVPQPTSRVVRRPEPARHARGSYPVRVARAASA